MISGSMGNGCIFPKFSFGHPWDPAFQACCLKTAPPSTSPLASSSTAASTGAQTSLTTLQALTTTANNGIPTPALDSLCDLLPGELCAHICIPVPDSYRCECRRGFSLMTDGKSCQQEDLPDRCKMNNPCAHKCVDTGVAIECSCHMGFQLAPDERSCNDIDECQLEVDACDHSKQVCRNEPGTYTCVNSDGSLSKPSPLQAEDSGDADKGKCPIGYQFNFQSQVCDDIDECLLNKAECGKNNVCQNTIGSYTCGRAPVEGCSPGFRYNSVQKTCKDVNECAEALDDCNREKQYCLNTEGSFTCQDRSEKSQCPAGYKFNKILSACEDVNECNEQLHDCLPATEVCRNTEGAYECDIKCNTGLQYDIARRACIDVNECEANITKCQRHETCINTVGSYHCIRRQVVMCPAGYKPSSEQGAPCEDVDECSESVDSCERDGEVCVNEVGSYRCESASSRSTSNVPIFPIVVLERKSEETPCPPGYSFSIERKACLDINECLTDLHNCSTANNSECINVPGSFICRQHIQCPAGHQFDQNTKQCEDVDECSDGTAQCALGKTCVNTFGSYHCSSPLCTRGYRVDPHNADRCVDIDECQEQSDTCNRVQEVCRNTGGGFSCEPCPKGFRRVNNILCEDVDECTENLHNCHPASQSCNNVAGSFRCTIRQPVPSCPSGFWPDPVSRSCLDMNECTDGRSACKAGEECVNTRGSYHCIPINATTATSTTVATTTTRPPATSVTGSDNCPAGFRYNPLRQRCFDINECVEQIHICNLESESCINEPGGYRCGPQTSVMPPARIPDRTSCQVGYKLHPIYRNCVDVDECAENIESPCDSNQKCVNTQGSYACTCRTGYHLDPVTQACVDINECQVNLHDCLTSQRCDNTIGSFHCIRFTSCGTGYTLNSQSGLCEDDDECVLRTDNCRFIGPIWQCRNTAGSFRCERKRCEGNLKLTSAGTCVGLDGKTVGTTTNPIITTTNERTTTSTTPPTSRAAPPPEITCPPGYEFKDGKCNDINECERPNTCRRNQRCINSGGTYRCVNFLNCNGGFEINEEGTQCVDVDECVTNTHDCGRGQLCQNRPGGYSCQCPAGHTLNNAKTCVDIDECKQFAGQVCSINSDCQNTPGSYRCLCKMGFRQAKDSKACEDIDECKESPGICHQTCINMWGSYHCICDPGFTINSDNRSCSDIDECNLFRDRHLCVGPCVNQPGSYTCRCPEGYRLGSDGRSCQDIDECQGGSICPSPNEICLNTRGSYRCNTINCPPNFVKDTEHKNRCKRASPFCREGDQACLRLPLSYSFNFITFVSNLAISPAGHLDLFTMRGPLWQTTTARFNLEMLDSRAPNGIQKVRKNFFRLRNTVFNQAVISLVESIPGPQEIELQLTMDLHHNGVYGGSAVAKLFIYVSQYEY